MTVFIHNLSSKTSGVPGVGFMVSILINKMNMWWRIIWILMNIMLKKILQKKCLNFSNTSNRRAHTRLSASLKSLFDIHFSNLVGIFWFKRTDQNFHLRLSALCNAKYWENVGLFFMCLFYCDAWWDTTNCDDGRMNSASDVIRILSWGTDNFGSGKAIKYCFDSHNYKNWR